MPPLPPKKSFEARVERSASVSSTASGSTAAVMDGAGVTSTGSYLSYKPANDGDSQAIHEAMVDPSSWVLKNSRTGQEVKAATFMEAVLARRPCPQWPSNSPQLGSSLSVSRGWPRRHRNKALQIQRPTFLPQGEVVSFAPAPHTGPPSPPPPPTQHLSFTSLSSKSPMRARGRSSLPGNTLSRARSISNSDSMSSAILSVSDGPRPFKLSNMSTTQIVPSLHVGGIRAICFSPSGEYLATCGVDKRCCVFRVRQCRRASAEGAEGAEGGSRTAFLEGEEEEGTTRRQSVSLAGRLIDDKPMRILMGHVDSVVALAWAGGDNELLSASADGTVRCWRPLEGDECAGVYEHGGAVTSVAWVPGSTQARSGGAVRAGRFITGCLDAKVRLFSLGCLEPEQSVLLDRPVTAVAFRAGGQTFAAGCVSGTVVFYRTEGMVPQLTVECRRHGFRHSAAQRTRLATSPVRRMSAGNENVGGSADGSVNGREGARRRRNTMGPKSRGRVPGPTEERVTGLCFRPPAKGLAELGTELSDGDGDESLLLSTMPPSVKEQTGEPAQERAPNYSVGGEVRAPEMDAQGAESDGDKAWLGPLADLLVSTNDNRSRILVAGPEGEVVVGFKLKGHNTEGALGRHNTARYSEDGELVISGSTDGNVHVFTTPSALGSSTPRRAVTWTNGREGHERAQVCDKTVAVPVALFAPASVVRNLGGSASRVILAGDELGFIKIFYERNVD